MLRLFIVLCIHQSLPDIGSNDELFCLSRYRQENLSLLIHCPHIYCYTRLMSAYAMQIICCSYLRPTVSRPVCLDIEHPPMAHDQLLTTVGRLRSSYRAPSLTIGWVCNFLVQMLLRIASAVTLDSKSRRIRDNILHSHLKSGSPFVAS
jgi:hypothetical protein